MSTIASGWITGFFLFDVAEGIDLDAVNRLIGPTTPARAACSRSSSSQTPSCWSFGTTMTCSMRNWLGSTTARFTVEQTSMARGELLELVIVLILMLELVLFFAGIMR